MDAVSPRAARRAATVDYVRRTADKPFGYGRPSSLFGQFGDEGITLTAAVLDRKLEALVEAAAK